MTRADDALQVYEGKALEKMLRLLPEQVSRAGKGELGLTDTVNGYWNKADGSDIQIDLVAADNDERVVRFGSCKRSASRFTSTELANFRRHVARFLTTREGARFADYKHQYALHSVSFGSATRRKLERLGYRCVGIDDFARLLDDE